MIPADEQKPTTKNRAVSAMGALFGTVAIVPN